MKYGVSFNCQISFQGAIGGGFEGETTLDYVSNDLQKLDRIIELKETS